MTVQAVKAVMACTVLAMAGTIAEGALRVESKSFDAGRVEVGDVIEHRFEVVNEGDRPVEIVEVRTTCGCTAPDYPEAIAAGARETITLRVDTAKLEPGRHSKSATVETDAGDVGRFVLQVKLELFAPLEFLPRTSLYLVAPAAAGAEQRVLARPHRAGMRVLEAVSDNENLSVSVVPAQAGQAASNGGPLPQDGDSWIVIALSPQAPVGLHRGKVTVRTSDPSYPQGVIAVNAVVNGKGKAARTR